MASVPIIGMEFDPFEELDRRQRRAIQQAVRARAQGDMPGYRKAMLEVDLIAKERVRLQAQSGAAG